MQIHEIVPPVFYPELQRLHAVNPEWLEVQDLEPGNQKGRYKARPTIDTILRRYCTNAADLFTFQSYSRYIGDGPKVFIPTAEQAEALQQVEVKLTVAEFRSPYPCIFVAVKDDYFRGSLVYCRPGELINCVLIPKNPDTPGITTTIRQTTDPIECSILAYDEDCKDQAMIAHRIDRIALNSCLMLTMHPTYTKYLNPAEVADDTRLAKRPGEAGEKAKARLSLALVKVSFTQDIKIGRKSKEVEEAEATGRKISCHWRRGHFAMLACGVGRTERRLTFRRPCLVAKDRFAGDAANTQTVYRG